MRKLRGVKYIVLIYVAVFAISMGLSAVLWPYSVNSWLEFVGKEGAMLWWHGAILGIIPHLGFVSIPVALITFVGMLIV